MEIKKLLKTFRRNGLNYYMIKRNDILCIYGVSGTYTDKILHYEVMLIRIRNDKFGHREVVPSDDEFGRTKPDRHFQTLLDAEAYFTLWTSNLI